MSHILLREPNRGLWRAVHSLRRWGGVSRFLILALALSLLAPVSAAAQTRVYDYGQQCTHSFLAACATLRYLDFGNTGPDGAGVLRLIVENTSGAAEPGAYIKKLRLDFLGTLPSVPLHLDENYGLAEAQYGTISGDFFTPDGPTEKWKAKSESGGELKEIPGFQKDFNLDDNAKEEYGGNPNLSVERGGAVMLTVTFASPFENGVGLVCMNDPECQGWTAEMKGLGDGSGKGYTTSPEPSTWLLLGSGMLLLAFARRRRRAELPPR